MVEMHTSSPHTSPSHTHLPSHITPPHTHLPSPHTPSGEEWEDSTHTASRQHGAERREKTVVHSNNLHSAANLELTFHHH